MLYNLEIEISRLRDDISGASSFVEVLYNWYYPILQLPISVLALIQNLLGKEVALT